MFVKLSKVRRKFRNRDHSSSSRQKRKASLEQRLFHRSLNEKSVESEIAYLRKSKQTKMKHSNSRSQKRTNQPKLFNQSPNDWLSERLKSVPIKQKHARSKSARPFKPGPRDIGRIEPNNGWTPIQYEENQNIKKPKNRRSRSQNPYKPGPRDIGWTNNTNWQPIQLSKEEQMNLNAGSFLDDRSRSKSLSRKHAKSKQPKIYKPGPRDIGRNNNSNWKPIQLSKQEQAKLNAGAFLDDQGLRRSKSLTRKKSNIYKPGPRDIGNNNHWKQRQNQKGFQIQVNDNVINPKRKKLPKTKDKQLMNGHRNKQMQKQRVYKAGPYDVTQNNNIKETRNQSMFNSFNRNSRKNQWKHDNNNQRKSVHVQLNKENKAKRKNSKHSNSKKRKSARKSTDHSKFRKKNAFRKVSDATVKKVRFNAHKSMNYQEFVPYTPNEPKKDDTSRNRHYSAANESERELDLGDDEFDEEQILNEDEFPDDDLFVDDGMLSDVDENEARNIQNGHNVTSSGHDHEYVGNGHVNDIDILFDIDGTTDDDIYDITIKEEKETKPKKSLPPNKPLPSIQRVKGIKQYTGKWKVSFDGITPKMDVKKRNSPNKKRRRTMSKCTKYNEPLTTFTYSIYKDGHVNVEPKNAFGWNGNAKVVFQEATNQHKIYPIQATGKGQFQHIRIEKDILHITHYALNSAKPIIGTGQRC